MNINNTGYLNNSKTKENDYNVIPSSHITTKGLAFPIFANGKLLLPNTGDYKFNTDHVLEVPALNKGGTMKKIKYKSKKMQQGGVTTAGALGAVGEGISLLSPNPAYQGTNTPNLGVQDAFAGAKAGMAFGPVGAGIGAAAGLTKDIIDYRQDIKQYDKNTIDARAQNKTQFDDTHHPYGMYGYNQSAGNKNVYSLFDGGAIKRNISTIAANDQTSHSTSLSKQEGGEIPNDLNELFDRAMEESGGDEDKAHEMVMKHTENPEMKQNKKRVLKKKKD